MPDWLALAAVVVGCWGAVCAALALWAEALPVGDECYEVTTADAWTLSLHRFLPVDGSPPKPCPLVLAHGLNMNRGCWALGSSASLIKALTFRGYDVFTLEYRGTSGSRPGNGKRWGYSLDDHINHDIPALLAEIERRTGSPQVDWVGHSMGGMLLYLYAGRHGSQRIRRAVTLGSPVRFGLPWGIPGGLAKGVARQLHSWLRTPLRLGSLMTLPISLALRRIAMRRLHNPDHFSLRELAGLCSSSLEDVSGPIHGAFLSLAAGSEHLCPPIDSNLPGLAPGALEALRSPLLVVSGLVDGVAPPRAVAPAFERCGSEKAAYLRLGSTASSGEPPVPPFGHCDLASGTAAITHVLPLIADWLEHCDPSASGATLSRGLEVTATNCAPTNDG